MHTQAVVPESSPGVSPVGPNEAPSSGRRWLAWEGGTAPRTHAHTLHTMHYYKHYRIL